MAREASSRLDVSTVVNERQVTVQGTSDKKSPLRGRRNGENAAHAHVATRAAVSPPWSPDTRGLAHAPSFLLPMPWCGNRDQTEYIQRDIRDRENCSSQGPWAVTFLLPRQEFLARSHTFVPESTCEGDFHGKALSIEKSEATFYMDCLVIGKLLIRHTELALRNYP